MPNGMEIDFDFPSTEATPAKSVSPSFLNATLAATDGSGLGSSTDVSRPGQRTGGTCCHNDVIAGRVRAQPIGQTNEISRLIMTAIRRKS